MYRFIEDETPGCTIGPNAFKIEDMVRGKRIAVFRPAGRLHAHMFRRSTLPGFIQSAGKFRDKKVDEVWCVSVNDAFVMGAQGQGAECQRQGAHDGDGSGSIPRRWSGVDLVQRGMGVRSALPIRCWSWTARSSP